MDDGFILFTYPRQTREWKRVKRIFPPQETLPGAFPEKKSSMVKTEKDGRFFGRLVIFGLMYSRTPDGL